MTWRWCPVGSPRDLRPAVPRVSVVIPTLNEAANLPHVMSELPEDIYELVLVDGNSIDGTVEVARELYPTVRIVGQSGRGKATPSRPASTPARATSS